LLSARLHLCLSCLMELPQRTQNIFYMVSPYCSWQFLHVEAERKKLFSPLSFGIQKKEAMSACACAIIMVPYLTDLSRVYSVVGVGWSHNNWFYEYVRNLKVFQFVMGKATRLMLLKVCERGDYDVIHAKSKLGCWQFRWLRIWKMEYYKFMGIKSSRNPLKLTLYALRSRAF